MTNEIQTLVTTVVEPLLGNYLWIFITGVIAIIFKSTIEKFACAIFVFFGSDLNEDDAVYVDGKAGRIIRVGLTKTTFFIYDIVDDKIVGGNKLVVQNERLSELKIEKPLDKLDLTKLEK